MRKLRYKKVAGLALQPRSLVFKLQIRDFFKALLLHTGVILKCLRLFQSSINIFHISHLKKNVTCVITCFADPFFLEGLNFAFEGLSLSRRQRFLVIREPVP